jgi:DNA-binding LacI/PurR family transcriptional regulator
MVRPRYRISMTASTSDARVTVRTIAAAAHVSPMTVSRALSNRPRIDPETRARIMKIAERMGYRPDPEVAKLMHHLRNRRKPTFQSVICALTTRPAEAFNRYTHDLAEGARQRAQALGYGFLLMHVMPGASFRRSLPRILLSRGVEGVLVLPLQEAADLQTLLPWSEFSAIAATSSVTAPLIHRVMPNHYANTLTLFRQLASHGYRRIGLTMSAVQDMRVNHVFTAAATWHNLHESKARIPPLIFDSAEPRALRKWFARHDPDAIVTNEAVAVTGFARTLGLRLPGPIGFASTSIEPSSQLTGIDELPMEVGAMAISLLASKLQRRERGLPVTPTATLIDGRWHPGKSSVRQS